MSLKWAGIPDRCPHGEYEDKECVRCENERLRTELARFARKVEHGCANFPCGLCDEEAKPRPLPRHEF